MTGYNFVCQAAHTLAGYAVMLTARAFWPGHPWTPAISMVVYALVKEFWYDARYELPPQSFRDNLTDFAFYCVGTGLGLVICGLTNS